MTAAPEPSPDDAGGEPDATPEVTRAGVRDAAAWQDWREVAGLVRTWPPVQHVSRWWKTRWTDDEPDRPTPWWLRAIALVVAGWLGILLAVFAGFLTPYRIHGWLIPVSLVFVVAGLVAMTRFAYAVTRHVWLSVLPGVSWLIVSLILSGRTREGDLVLTEQNWVATVYLLLGSVTLGVLAYRMVVPRPVMPPQPPLRGRPAKSAGGAKSVGAGDAASQPPKNQPGKIQTRDQGSAKSRKPDR